MASRGSFCPPEIASLILARICSSGMPAFIVTLSNDRSGSAPSGPFRASICRSIEAVQSLQCASTAASPVKFEHPSIIPWLTRSISAKSIFVSPVITRSAWAETGIAKSRTRSPSPASASLSSTARVEASNCAFHTSRTVRGETVGKIILRSAI